MDKIILYFKDLSGKKIAFLIIFIGLLAYGNIFLNGFVGDDSSQITNNPLVHEVANMPRLFLQGTFYDESGQINNYYKPILSTTYSILYLFSGENPFLYHLAQVLIHIADAFLVFLIFRYFFKKELAFSLSLIFLVHPINTEAVTYISALQENLFIFFGLIVLYLSAKQLNNIYTQFSIPILLLVSLLSKEAGIVFLILIPIFNFLYNKKKLLESVAQSVIVVFLYIFLRIDIGHIGFISRVKVAPIQVLPIIERIINIPKIVFFYLHTFFYPKYLLMFQTWTVKSFDFVNFYLPLLIDVIFFILLTLMGIRLLRRDKNSFRIYLFFFIWFVIGLGMHLQILPLDETVSERWFYFPIIGLLGMFGVIFAQLKIKSKVKPWIILLFILIIISFLIRVIDRTFDWRSDVSLFTHDVKFNRDSYQLEKGLGNLAYENKDVNTAKNHYFRSVDLFPNQITFSSLGYFYLQMKRPDKAVYAYNKAVSYDKSFAVSLYYLAIAKYNANDRKGALVAAKKAYFISPTNAYLQILTAIENNVLIDVK
jgi:protein O-mannosyl-transferase